MIPAGARVAVFQRARKRLTGSQLSAVGDVLGLDEADFPGAAAYAEAVHARIREALACEECAGAWRPPPAAPELVLLVLGSERTRLVGPSLLGSLDLVTGLDLS